MILRPMRLPMWRNSGAGVPMAKPARRSVCDTIAKPGGRWGCECASGSSMLCMDCSTSASDRANCWSRLTPWRGMACTSRHAITSTAAIASAWHVNTCQKVPPRLREKSPTTCCT